MKKFSVALSFVCLSVMETVVGYAISIQADVVVNNEGHNEDSSLHLVLDYVIGRQHKSCSNETVPQKHSPTTADHSTLCGSDQKRIESTITLCPVVNHSDFTTSSLTSTEATTPVPTPTTPVPTPTTPVPTSIPTACKNDFIRLGDQCYHFRTHYTPWKAALTVCKGLGATLAHPKNSKENSLVLDYIHKNNIGTNFWLGGTWEGRWVWAHDKSPIIYNDWKSGRPASSGQGHCIHIADNSDWKWSDAGCSSTSGAICQQ